MVVYIKLLSLGMDWKTFVVCILLVGVIYTVFTEAIHLFYIYKQTKILKDLPIEKIKAITELEKK